MPLTAEQQKKQDEMMAAEIKCPVNLEEVDLFSPGAQEHWFDAYRILHKEAPVHPIPGEGALPGTDAFILSKYDDIAAVVRDPVQFPMYQAHIAIEDAAKLVEENGIGALVPPRDTVRPTLELHKKQRLELTGPWVGPEGAHRNTEMITHQANELIDGWIDRGEVDFVSEFAAPLPQRVITTVIGFPLEDLEITRHWADAQVQRFVFGYSHKNLLTPEEEKANAAELADLFAYSLEQVAKARKNPGDNLISDLTQVEFNGRSLTDEEIAGIAGQMHIGGHDTTRYVIAAEGMLLAQHPEIVEELRKDRSKIRFFVEEALRLFAPTQGLSTRLVIEDTEIRGVQIPRGSILHLRYGAANRDPDLCPNSESIDLERKNPGRHLTFSMGPRVCPGAGLSRLEQNIAVGTLIDRLDELAIAPNKNDFRNQPGIMLGMNELHLTFKKR
ncbi:MAG: cytochrome P450 [Dehalococcoidia bacterium]|nr:cytochrome P450 [Dehalococcoidia bacterium]|tara:strand:+ start:1726 stop:3054 length:1329 start_codon:yes stop_codon:yes gene_type:complete